MIGVRHGFFGGAEFWERKLKKSHIISFFPSLSFPTINTDFADWKKQKAPEERKPKEFRVEKSRNTSKKFEFYKMNEDKETYKFILS